MLTNNDIDLHDLFERVKQLDEKLQAARQLMLHACARAAVWADAAFAAEADYHERWEEYIGAAKTCADAVTTNMKTKQTLN